MISITFDTDHMTDVSMETFLKDLDIPGSATFFCTQRYRDFDAAFRGIHEIAAHPVFRPGADWKDATLRLREDLGGVVGVRPHSCAYDHHLGVFLAENDFRYVSQSSWLFHDGLHPHYHPWGLWEMPIYYMDNMDYSHVGLPGQTHQPFSPQLIDNALKSESLFVFDFHPILVLLNAANAREYGAWVEEGRPDIRASAGTGKSGSANFLAQLSAAMRSVGCESVSLGELARTLDGAPVARRS